MKPHLERNAERNPERDLAHEADMARLRRQQLRDDIGDDEILLQWEEDDRYYLEEAEDEFYSRQRDAEIDAEMDADIEAYWNEIQTLAEIR